jgi:hypothetical protein
VDRPREPELFDRVRLVTGQVEEVKLLLREGWQPGAGTFAALVHQHDQGVFEAELFDHPDDYAPVAMAIVTTSQVELIDGA